MEDRDGVEFESILDVEVSLADFATVVVAGSLCVAMVVLAPMLHAMQAALLSAVWSWLHAALAVLVVVTMTAWC